MKVESKTLDWLMEPTQPVIQYYALTSLLDRKENDPEVRDAREKVLKKGWAADILETQNPEGYWEAAQSPEGYSLYNPKYTASNWQMIVLSDFPLSFRDDVRLERGCSLFFKNWLGNEDEFEAQGEVCISGNLARVLTKLGYGDDPRVKRVVDWLVKNQKEDGGWHCFRSKTGSLDCWEALAAFAAIPKEKRKVPQQINRKGWRVLSCTKTSRGGAKIRTLVPISLPESLLLRCTCRVGRADFPWFCKRSSIGICAKSPERKEVAF